MIPTPFAALDALRRGQGLVAEALGTGPREQPFAEIARWPGARLRRYAGGEGGMPLLVIPAPFKRPYIWDLAPHVSVPRAAIAAGFDAFLLEWLSPDLDRGAAAFGLADYALRLPEAALAAIAKVTGRDRAVLAGHSLGGTFAAICAAARPDAVAALALVDAPLAFARDGGPIADAVAAAPDAARIAAPFGPTVPGAAINVFSARAAPEPFIRQPERDARACATRPERMAIHLRVRRWTLDEFPMPARLFVEIAEDLYRNDRFRRGDLDLAGERIRLADLAAPVAAVVNPVGVVVPPRSLLAGLRALRPGPRIVLRYRPEPGPAIQHLGPLVGPDAHRVIWPRLLDWLMAPQPRGRPTARRGS